MPFRLLALTVVGVMTTSVLVTLPVLAAAMARQVGGGPAAIGYLASADMFGSALACLATARRVRQVDWRFWMRLALLAVVVGNLASIPVTGMASLLLLRLIVGACGGAALSIAFVGLCHSPSPDRAFGLFVFVQLLLQAALLPLFSFLLTAIGIASLYVALAGVAALALALVAWIPRGFTPGGEQAAEAGGKRSGIWGPVSVIGLGVYFVAPAMIWSYFEPIGRRFDLAAGEIGASLGLSAFAGIAGAATVLLLREERRRATLILIGMILSIVSLLPIYGGHGYFLFLASACLLNFAWNFTFPYLMGIIAHYDEGGETAIHSLAAQLLGLAAGPLAGAGLLSSGRDYPTLATVAILILALSLILFLRADFVGRRAIRRAQPLAR